MTQQNKDLQRELDSFVETDDIVRRNLDRKEKVNEIRTKVDYAIHNSMNQYQQTRSPRKEDYHNASGYNARGGVNNSTYNNRDFSPAKKNVSYAGNKRTSPLRSGSPKRY